MGIEYGDDEQARLRGYVNAVTLSKLLSLSTVPIVYGRHDDDDGDDDGIRSERRIGDDGDENES